MIEAIGLLPFVQAKRKLDDRRYMECTTCKESSPPEHRAALACGWIAEHPKGVRAPQIPGCDTVATICPGYAQHDARVQEAYAAWAWFDKGQLGLRHKEPSDLLICYIDLANAAIAASNEWFMEESQRKAKQNRG